MKLQRLCLHIFTVLTLAFGATNLSAQCIPDSNFAPGWTTALDSGCVGQMYDDTIHFAFEDSITVPTFQGIMTFRLVDVEINFISNLAPGLQVDCTNPNCNFQPQLGQIEYGCIRVYGTPTGGSPADSITLNITYTIQVFNGQTFDFDMPRRVGLIIGPFAGFTTTQDAYTVDFSLNNPAATNYMWHFGDGDSTSFPNPSHTYDSIGTYMACLTITDACGTGTTCDTVRICGPMEADFTWELVADSVQFYDHSSGLIQQYFWNFGGPGSGGPGGGNNFSNDKDPTHYYNGIWSTYLVCLTVVDSCGQVDSSCHTINTFPLAVEDAFEGVKIWPNPVSEELHLNGNNLQFTLRDLYGRKLREESGNDLTWDLSSYTNGVYFVEVSDGTQKITRKILKK